MISPQLSHIEFGIPSKTPAQGYLLMHYQLAIQLGNIMADLTTNTDPRIRYFTHFIVSLLPDEEKRELARNYLSSEIQKIQADTKLPNDEKAYRINVVCFETIGHIWSYLDEFIGIEKKLKVGEIGEVFADEGQEEE